MRALVLSGGGVKGAYQVGALRRWIVDEGREYDILCGVSVGAINAAFLSQFPKGQLLEGQAALEALWGRVNNANVRKNWWLFGKLASLWKPSVYDSRPLMAWIKRELNVDAIKASGRKLRLGAVSWQTGEYYAATEQDNHLAEWVTASSSFPAFLSPVAINGQLWTDGGVRNVTPLGEAIRLGAETIDMVMCGNPDLPQNWSSKGQAALPGYAVRGLGLMADEIERTDLEVCGLKNDLAALDPRYRKVEVNLVRPSAPLVEDSLDFNPDAIRRMVQTGYEDACKAG